MDPWQGWRWQVALLLLGGVAAAALGVHLQTRQQLRIDTERLLALQGSREASLQARARYEKASRELEALRALVPRLSQLELLDRVIASGIFASAADERLSDSRQGPGHPAPGVPASAAATGSDGARMLEWDYRNGQLKMTLELPDRDVTLLDVTRRLESVPGLGALRVGQDSAGNTLTLSASIAELAPPADTQRDRAASLADAMARTALLQRFRIDRRLLMLAGIAALLILGELGLARLRGAPAARRPSCARRAGRVDVLAAGSDQIDWARAHQAAEDERNELQGRLWQSPSEAQAQARLRDWLTSALRSAAVARPRRQPAAAAGGARAPRAPPKARRVHAARCAPTVNFDLAPNALENASCRSRPAASWRASTASRSRRAVAASR